MNIVTILMTRSKQSNYRTENFAELGKLSARYRLSNGRIVTKQLFNPKRTNVDNQSVRLAKSTCCSPTPKMESQ